MALFYFVFESKFQLKAPWGACIRMGDLAEGFLHYNFGGGGEAYIWKGLYMQRLIFGILWYLKRTAYFQTRSIPASLPVGSTFAVLGENIA